MIAYIKGELVILEEDRVIVDVGGVGYGIYMPGRAMSALPPIGSEVLIHTYLNVKVMPRQFRLHRESGKRRPRS